APDAPTVSDDPDFVTVCKHDGSACHKLVPAHEVDPGIGITTAANASGTLAAIFVQGATSYVEVFDVASAKHVATFTVPNAGMCGFVAFAGDTLDVTAVDCGVGMTGTDFLYTKGGKRLAKLPFMTGSPPAHVDGNVWAFTPGDGSVVVLHDVVTGKLVKRISVGKADPDAWATLVGDGAHLVL